MTDADLLRLKSSIDKLVEINTASGERLVAKVLWVFDGEDNADVFYELVSTSCLEAYPRRGEKVGYSLPLADILSVKAIGEGEVSQ